MKVNKRLSLVVGTMLTISMLSACGSSTNEEKSSQVGDATPNINITMSSRSLPYVAASPDINEDVYVKKLEELAQTNLDIDFIPATDFDQKLNLLLAANEKMPDLLEISSINSSVTSPATDNGAFMELNELIDQYGPNLKANIPQSIWDSPLISKEGKIYAIPVLAPATINHVVYMRKDWLDKLGLEIPKTVDEYLQVLLAFRDRDPNGNGQKDEIPFSGRKDFNFAETFFGAYDVNPGGWKYINNQLVPKFILPEMKEALKVYQYMYKEKLLDNEMFVQEGKDWDAKIKGVARVGMWIHDQAYPDKWQTEVKMGDPNAQIINIPAPVGPDGKGGAESASPIRSAYAIPASSKKAVEVIKYLNWFFTTEADTFLTYGIDGVDYTMNNGKIEYKYPSNLDEINKENMHLMFLQFTGKPAGKTKEFLSGRANGDLIVKAAEIASKEGRTNEAIGMPNPSIIVSQPELSRTGLFMEAAAKIVTGQEEIDSFDKFVTDWKARGGAKAIEDATAWYNKVHQ